MYYGVRDYITCASSSACCYDPVCTQTAALYHLTTRGPIIHSDTLAPKKEPTVTTPKVPAYVSGNS
jgi:hypothetical protein